MTANIMSEITLEVTECCACGTQFAVPEVFLNQRRRNGQDFYCPNGHTLHYKDNEIDKLKKQLKAKEKALNDLDNWYEAEKSDHEHTRNRLRATKGVLTKTKKRIGNGTCPCCGFGFPNLRDHMLAEHPDYTQEVPEGE